MGTNTSNPAGNPRVFKDVTERPAAPSAPTEFKKFEDLTRKLVNTPKPAKKP